MRSSFTGIEMAKRSLFTHQTALTTTGHNLANANTRGYTRQVVNLVAARPIEAIGFMRSNTPGQLGQSVEFSSITRVREQFLDSQFTNENKLLGDWTVRRDTLEKLEAIVNEPSKTGIRQVLDNFWNAWQELSKAPDNLTARAVVKESAYALSDAFNHVSTQLKDLTSDLTDNINVKMREVNMLAEGIASLNENIYRMEGLGNNANDLRDQRDVLIDDLSRVINIDVVETEAGYTVSMGNINLVTGREVTTTFTSDSFEQAFDSGDLNSGEIYGLILSRDKYVADYRQQLDTMVNALVQGDVEVTLPEGMVLPEGTELNGITYSGSIEDRTLNQDMVTTVKGINGIHKLGYIQAIPVTAGLDFFTTKDGSGTITAANITLNPNIGNNVENIAASTRTYMDGAVEKVVVGNNAMALLIAGMKLQKFNFDPDNTGQSVLNGGTIDEYFRAVIGELGVQSKEATRQADNQLILVDQIDSRRQSVSGVSLDEEIANMIMFQHAYNAAARSLTTFDEMLDKVINGMGIVGR